MSEYKELIYRDVTSRIDGLPEFMIEIYRLHEYVKGPVHIMRTHLFFAVQHWVMQQESLWNR